MCCQETFLTKKPAVQHLLWSCKQLSEAEVEPLKEEMVYDLLCIGSLCVFCLLQVSMSKFEL